MIRRPLFPGTLAFCAAILISFFMGRVVATGVLMVLIFVWKMQKLRLRKNGAAILLAFYAVSLGNIMLYQIQHDPFAVFDGSAEGNTETVVCGSVISSSVRTAGSGDPCLQITLQVEQLNGQRISRSWYERPVKLLVRQYPKKRSFERSGPENAAENVEPIAPGTELCISGTAEIPSARRNPNCFDYRLYLKSIGIDRTMTAERLEILKESRSLQGRIFLCKEAYLQRLKTSAGEDTAGLMRGILFGEKTEIDEDILEAFQRNGTAHILAVSGLHIGILYGVLAVLWRGKKGWLYFWMVTLVLLGYSFLASFSPSVVRASVMILLHLYAKVRHLRYDLSSASFVVLLCILLKNPMQLFHAGLQMSFLAVLTLSAVVPFFRKVYQGIFLSSGVVQLGLLPYTAYLFNYVSLISVFVNVPIIFLAGFLVPLGIGGFAADLCPLPDGVPAPVMSLLGQILRGLCRMLTMCNEMTCIRDVTSFEVTSPPRSFLAAYYLLLLLFLSEEGRLLILRKRKKMIVLLTAFCLGASLLFGQVTTTGFEDAAVVFVDVGQGDCMHIRTEHGENYLVDGGGKMDYNLGKKTLKPYLLKNGVRRVDGAFVTHLHTDHYKGIAELCREGMVRKLYLYEGNRSRTEEICRDTGLSPEDLMFLHAGQKVITGADYVEVLWPEAAGTALQKKGSSTEEEDENEVSLILKIHAGGMSLLATGDVDEACENRLAERYRNGLETDLLKVAHHGSRYSWSDDFARYAKPQAAIFQVGKNNYGHPNGDVIEGYEKGGAEIYRNDLQGAVGFLRRGKEVSDGGKTQLEVVTMIPERYNKRQENRNYGD